MKSTRSNTGEKYICFNTCYGFYDVQIKRDGVRYYQSFNSMAEAITYRNQLLRKVGA